MGNYRDLNGRLSYFGLNVIEGNTLINVMGLKVEYTQGPSAYLEGCKI
jgi:hypothetical protein